MSEHRGRLPLGLVVLVVNESELLLHLGSLSFRDEKLVCCCIAFATYTCACMCVCVCVSGGEGERETAAPELSALDGSGGGRLLDSQDHCDCEQLEEQPELHRADREPGGTQHIVCVGMDGCVHVCSCVGVCVCM